MKETQYFISNALVKEFTKETFNVYTIKYFSLKEAKEGRMELTSLMKDWLVSNDKYLAIRTYTEKTKPYWVSEEEAEAEKHEYKHYYLTLVDLSELDEYDEEIKEE